MTSIEPQPSPDASKPGGNALPPASDSGGTSIRQWLKRAFSVDDGPQEPSAEEAAVVDKVLESVVKRGLTTPAMLFLESSRPLNYIGAQALTFLGPMAEVVLPAGGYRLFTQFLERRGSIDYLCRRLQELSDERRGKQ